MLKITKNQGSIQVTADKSGFYPFDGTITFPTNSLFTATSANTDMITFKSTSNGDVQFVGNYKDITISGRSYDTKQKFLTAFSNLANQGSVDAYTKAETDAKIDAKQGKLKAGNGITLTEDATDNTTVVKTAVSLTDNGNGAYQVGDSITIDSKSSVRIGKKWAQEIEDMTDRVTTIAIGYDARTNDTYGGGDIAIGDGAQSFSVGAVGSIAIGKDTMAQAPTGHSSIAIGSGAKVTKADADGIVIGSGAKVNDGSDSIVIGNNARTETSSDSVAIGHVAVSKQSYGIAIGRGAGAMANDKVTNSDSIAIGHFATADGNASIALGHYSDSKKGGVAIGTSCKAKAEKGIAIGEWAMASVENGVAIGELAQTEADKPLVIRAGNKTVDGQKLPITMIQGDANGKISIIKGDGTDTRMVIQDEIEALKNAGGGGANPLVVVKGTNGDATIPDNITDAVAIGSGASVVSEKSVAIGSNAKVSGWSVAIGQNAQANNFNAVAIGYSANASSERSVAIGNVAQANDSYTVAIGNVAQALSKRTVAIGMNARTSSSTPLVINAGYKTVDGIEKPLTVLQSDATGKLSVLKGDGTDERMVIQDEIAALKNAGGSGGTVDAYTKAETDTKLEAKQDKLTAGSGITIDENNVISSTGGSGGSANPLVNVKGTGSATITDSVTEGVAIGSDANVLQSYGVCVGYKCKSFTSSVAIGKGCYAEGGSTVAIGDGANASMFASSSIAVGSGARANSNFSLAIGKNARTSTDTPMVINAGGKTMIQGDKNGKISILLGDGTDTRIVISDEITALKAEITTLKAEIAALKGGA